MVNFTTDDGKLNEILEYSKISVQGVKDVVNDSLGMIIFSL